MVRKFLNLFLAGVIFSCPLRCQLDLTGSCCSTATVTQAAVGKCCCDELPDFCPCPLPETPCKKCKCICSGATLPDQFEFDWTIQCQPLCELFPSVVIQPDYMLASDLRPPNFRKRFSSANIGRTLRCLICSLTI